MNFKDFGGSDIQGYHSVHIGKQIPRGDEYKMKMGKTFDAFLAILWPKYRVVLFAPVAVKREITLHLTYS